MGDNYFRKLFVGETVAADGTQPYGRAARTFEQLGSNVHGKYYEQAKRGNVFYAQTLAVAPVAFGTEAGTGGPFLYNPTTSHDAVLLDIYISTIVASGQAGAVGLVFGHDENAPTTSNAITQSGPMRQSAGPTRMTVLNDADVLGTNLGFLALAELGTGAITVGTSVALHIPIDGQILVPPRGFVSIAGSVVLTTWQAHITFIYEEVPV